MITVDTIRACVLTAHPLIEIAAGRAIKVTRLSGTHRVHDRWMIECDGWHGKPISRSPERVMYYVRSFRKWAERTPMISSDKTHAQICEEIREERRALTCLIDHWLNSPEITLPMIRDMIRRLDSIGGRL